MIGLRVDQGLFSAIRERADNQGVSTTSCARLLIAEALGYNADLPLERARRRRSKKPVQSELKNAVQFLALLIDISTDLRSVVRRFGEMSAREEFSEAELRSTKILMKKTHDSLAEIRAHLLERAQ